jgi:hypothetical protein
MERGEHTQVPTLTRDVVAATAPAIETPSQTPWGGAFSARHSSSSGVHSVSKPIASASRAIARMSGQRGVIRSGPNCAMGRTKPISNGRTDRSSHGYPWVASLVVIPRHVVDE